jgi:hypothetical protein
MVKLKAVEVRDGDLRKQCLEAIKQWPGCETVSGIQTIRNDTGSGFSGRVTLYGEANHKFANGAMIYIQREQ